MSGIHSRYHIKLKNGESIVIHTDNNENKFICLPKTIINKEDISYIKVDCTNR